MGGFYTSLHVRAPRIVREAGDAIVSLGVLERAPDESEPDQIVYVREGEPWSAILRRVVRPGRGFARRARSRLTKALQTWSLGIIVHDSDVVMLRLHKDGELID